MHFFQHQFVLLVVQSYNIHPVSRSSLVIWFDLICLQYSILHLDWCHRTLMVLNCATRTSVLRSLIIRQRARNSSFDWHAPLFGTNNRKSSMGRTKSRSYSPPRRERTRSPQPRRVRRGDDSRRERGYRKFNGRGRDLGRNQSPPTSLLVRNISRDSRYYTLTQLMYHQASHASVCWKIC